MNEGAFRVHQIELMIQTSPRLGNGRRVTQHTHGSLYFLQVTSRYSSGGLVVDTYLKHTAIHYQVGALFLNSSLVIIIELHVFE